VTRTLGGWILGTHAATCETGKVVKNGLVILEKQVAGLNEETLQRFVLRARRAVGLRGMVNVLVTSSTAVRSLNRQFRRQNAETDVLSFPSMALPSKSRKQANLAGDVAISADIARQNSDQLGHAAVEEIKILALHGILHLAGFDHERDNGEMARQELKLCRALGLPAALIERAQSERGQSSPLPRRPTGANGARRMA